MVAVVNSRRSKDLLLSYYNVYNVLHHIYGFQYQECFPQKGIDNGASYSNTVRTTKKKKKSNQKQKNVILHNVLLHFLWFTAKCSLSYWTVIFIYFHQIKLFSHTQGNHLKQINIFLYIDTSWSANLMCKSIDWFLYNLYNGNTGH